MAKKNNDLSAAQAQELLETLKTRFGQHMNRHQGLQWASVEKKLKALPEKLRSLYAMEETGGEPDVIAYDKKADEYTFADCSPESPKGRRSICYDEKALQSRKENKPKNSAMGMAAAMGVELLDEDGYRALQKLGTFDTKTSSWLKTPPEIRSLGGAIFADFRYGTIFIYHNGAESYYAGRSFRGSLKV